MRHSMRASGVVGYILRTYRQSNHGCLDINSFIFPILISSFQRSLLLHHRIHSFKISISRLTPLKGCRDPKELPSWETTTMTTTMTTSLLITERHQQIIISSVPYASYQALQRSFPSQYLASLSLPTFSLLPVHSTMPTIPPMQFGISL
jgi:hypothetical protein